MPMQCNNDQPGGLSEMVSKCNYYLEGSNQLCNWTSYMLKFMPGTEIPSHWPMGRELTYPTGKSATNIFLNQYSF